MALCAFGKSGRPEPQEWELIDSLLNRTSILKTLAKDDMKLSPYFNIGLRHPAFTQLARRFSDELFHRFETYARKHLTKGYPLLISGGCGLNCDWNSAWKDTGLFEDLFIPPCANDTGSAIGTAIDAMRALTGRAKADWSVYCGQEFVEDEPSMHDVVSRKLDLKEVSAFLADGNVVAWTSGRREIGPRALGNRSIFAAPFKSEMQVRLADANKERIYGGSHVNCMPRGENVICENGGNPGESETELDLLENRRCDTSDLQV